MNARRQMEALWRAIAAQEREAIRACFSDDAEIDWPNSNERFTVEEFIRVNCEYPGSWAARVERVEEQGDLVVCAARVWSRENGTSVHAVGFYQRKDGRITRAEEYWGEDGPAPEWRRALEIGTPIDGGQRTGKKGKSADSPCPGLER